MTLKYLCYLLLLAIIWGSSFSFIKVATHDFGSIPLAVIRIFLAAIFLIMVTLLIGREKTCFKLLISKQHRIHLLFSGLLGQLLPFILYAQAEQTISASIASILNATTPFWTAIIAYVWLKKQASFMQIFGMLLGFIGVAILITTPVESLNSSNIISLHYSRVDQILGAMLTLFATLCYGYGANYLQTFLHKPHPLDVATNSTIYATIIGIPFAIFFWPESAISRESWQSALLLGVVCTGLAFILFFNIISHMGANFAVSVTFLIPIFGVLWGVVYLNETINTIMIVSMIIILIGVVLSNFKQKE